MYIYCGGSSLSLSDSGTKFGASLLWNEIMTFPLAQAVQTHVHYLKTVTDTEGGLTETECKEATEQVFNMVLEEITKISGLDASEALEILGIFKDTTFQQDQRGHLARMIHSKVGGTDSGQRLEGGGRKDRQKQQRFYNLHKCLPQEHWDTICAPDVSWHSKQVLWKQIFNDCGMSNPMEKMYTYVTALQTVALSREQTLTVDAADFYSKANDIKQAVEGLKRNKQPHHGEVNGII